METATQTPSLSAAGSLCMDASAGSSPPHSQENPAKHGGGRGEEPAEEIGGDDFMFADDTFPSLPEFPCLSSPSSSTYTSSSSSNSGSSAYTSNAGGAGGGGASGGGEPSEPASAGEGFDALEDINQILDFASLSVPWDSEPLFPESMGMMIEDAMSAPPHPASNVPGAGSRSHGKEMLEGAGGGEACMETSSAGDDLARFFMEWLRNNRDKISAEDLRGIRLRRSTIEAAAARLGGGRLGTLQLLKLILTWVQQNHLQKKRPLGAGEEAGNSGGYEFPAGGQDAATTWAPYQQSSFTPSSAYGESAVYPSGGAGPQQYTFHQQSCGTSSVVVKSQPFSPPAVGDMHASGGGGTNISWPPPQQQYVQLSAVPRVVPHQPFSPGFAGQYPMAGASQQRMAGVESSATKEARKKRMARQRRAVCLQQQRTQQLGLGLMGQIQGSVVLQQEPSPQSAPVTPTAGGWFWPSSTQQIHNPLSKSNSSTQPMMQQVSSPEVSAAPPAATPKPASSARREESPQRVATASDKRQSGSKGDNNVLKQLLQKVLKQSDVGSLGRIVLPKKEAEIHLPELKTRDGISIPMEDIGTSRVWNMRYRFWPNNKSRMYLLENTGDFVRSNELQEGDFIVIYSDVKSGKYLIRGVKVRPGHEPSLLGKHKHGCLERAAGASGSEDGGSGGLDGTGKTAADGGACKSSNRSPHAAARREFGRRRPPWAKWP